MQLTAAQSPFETFDPAYRAGTVGPQQPSVVSNPNVRFDEAAKHDEAGD
jgi:hypothetical protein